MRLPWKLSVLMVALTSSTNAVTCQAAQPGVPHQVYGPPSTASPEPIETNQAYGPPGIYGQPEVIANGGYSYERPETPFSEPNNEYGPPQQPGADYGPPGQGQLPVDQGASERLRQQQFRQHLPSFEAAKFAKPQRVRLQAQSQRTPQVHGSAGQLQRLAGQRQIAFASIQSVSASLRSLSDGITEQNLNAKVEPVTSGEYYVIEPRGRLQKVSYTTRNGHLLDGDIISGLQADNIQTINAPIYAIDKCNHLIRVN